ncbi:MAG: group II intron reverse transcriptase/maturase [Clostridia bacterium]|nr:group II intron reverse transcriptase/maturase [Clostridia bacterium]
MRTKKKSKLRNAEYYDIQQELDELYKKSKKNCKFTDLLSIITSEENIKLAYRNIKKNHGSKTAGTDGKTIQDLEKWQTETLINHIRKKLEYYKPQAIRRVEIPKPNGKKRPLGIPTIMDRLIQQCIYQILEPIAEAKFHERSNGFRPNRSTEHAIAQVYKMVQTQQLYYIVDIDIKAFFDNVQHGKLLKQMWQIGIQDKKLLKIISVMLKAEVAGIGFPEKGTPQGGIISPLLSNIVLNELDWWIASQWETMPTKHEYQGRKTRTDNSSKYRALRSSKLKECYLVRYADDFKILCKHHNDAKRLFIATQKWLRERLGLEINTEKSNIIDLRKNYSEFLGFKIKVHRKGKRHEQKVKYTIHSRVSDKAIKRIKDTTSRIIKRIEFPKDEKKEVYAIDFYNSFVMGVHNYYCLATCVNKDFDKIAFHVRKRLRNRLKSRLSRKGVIQYKYIEEKYGKSKEIRFIHGKAIIPLGYVQHQNPMWKNGKVNKYTPEGRKEIHNQLQKVNLNILHYLMRNPNENQSVEYNDNRLSLYCAMQGKCAITKTILEKDNIHCHHIIPRKDGGGDNYQNLLLIDKRVHILLHAAKAETIEKYLGILNLSKAQLNKLNTYRAMLNLSAIETKFSL